jgi:peptidoglycan/LPS O-acetylase OafA/YrhL
MHPRRSKEYLPTLDDWRAIARLSVLGDHVLGPIASSHLEIGLASGEVSSSEQG